jgi:hypothetical protein
MGHAIQVPDELYDKLAAYAKDHGHTPEDLVVAWVADVVRQAGSQRTPDSVETAEDPIAPFIGAFRFGVGDLGKNHDRYLAEAYEDVHGGEQ